MKVSVIILNLNGLTYTLDCIKSVKASVFRDFEIIVVDNGSSDGSKEALKKVKGIRLISLPKNVGFAEGNNVGFRAAKGDFICMLNNDTKVDRHWLQELVSAKADVCNPKFFDKYGAKDYHFHGYGTLGLFMAPVFLPGLPKESQDKIRCITASGSAYFDRRLGEPFDPDYFAYAEDAQFGWRANLMGKKVVHVPQSIVHHEGAVTAKSMDVAWDFFFILAERNKMLNILTLYSFGTIIRLFPYFIAYPILSTLYDPRHFFSRVKVKLWLLWHLPTILRKRKALQSKRKVSDKEIVKFMSSKVYDEFYMKGFLRHLVKALNHFFYAYCWLVRLKTVEFHIYKKVGDFLEPVPK